MTHDPDGGALAASGVAAPRRSGVADGLTAEDVRAGLREWWALGRDAFMSRYGGRPAERYVVRTDFGDVDALALIFGARSLAGMDTVGPWRGDRVNVARPLRDLGFSVAEVHEQTQPEVAALEAAIEDAAGRSRRGSGFQVDQRAKLAIEARAMELARQHYEPLGVVVDTALRETWDYEVDIDGDCWHVEVKGTTGDPVDVLLTPGQVAHARTYPFVALYVVSNIEVQTGPGDARRAVGGRVTLHHPWAVDDGELRPLGYKYRLPGRLSDPV